MSIISNYRNLLIAAVFLFAISFTPTPRNADACNNSCPQDNRPKCACPEKAAKACCGHKARGCARAADSEKKNADSASIYNYSVYEASGNEIFLANFKGKVMLIVNTATGCGFTPQYKELEKLYEKYHSKGLEIIDIPCNQFGSQAPGTDEEIHSFCQLNYNTQFPQMKKSDVNGANELPLYAYLKSQKGFIGFDDHPFKEKLENAFDKMDANWRNSSDIKWNFTKFVVSRDGIVTARFEPTAPMENVEKEIANLL